MAKTTNYERAQLKLKNECDAKFILYFANKFETLQELAKAGKEFIPEDMSKVKVGQQVHMIRGEDLENLVDAFKLALDIIGSTMSKPDFSFIEEVGGSLYTRQDVKAIMSRYDKMVKSLQARGVECGALVLVRGVIRIQEGLR